MRILLVMMVIVLGLAGTGQAGQVRPMIGGFYLGLTIAENQEWQSELYKPIELIEDRTVPCMNEDDGIGWSAGLNDPDRTTICTRNGIVSGIIHFVSIKTFAGSIALYRYIRDAKASIASVPGMVVDEDSVVDFRAHDRAGHSFSVTQEDDDVWVTGAL